jgi:long-chain fatty acid transport protein
MFVTPHGARPLGRGGAFVAGADDLNAIYYNPAGVAAIDYGASGWSGLFDIGFVQQNVAFTRNENGIMLPTVTANDGVLGSVPLGIPQFAFARKFLRPWGSMSFGFGVWIPYTGLPRYPEPAYDNEADLEAVPTVAPQRYALVSLQEGSLATVPLGAVLNPVAAFSLLQDKLQVGIGPQLLVLYLRAKTVLNGCPNVMCRPEQPDYDTVAVAQAFAMTPSFNIGVMGKPLRWFRLGLAFQFPFYVRSMVGTIDTQLPVNPLFNGASVQGRSASLSANLPPILRVGIEFYPIGDLRIELAYTAEFWAIQQDITFTPNNVSIVNLPGIGTYPLGPVSIPRDMQNTHSIHLGLEGTIWKYIGARLGGMFETSSMPDATITVLTPDNYKGLLSVGLFVPKLHFLKTDWRFDLSYGHIFQPDRYVSPYDSQIYPSNPLRPTTTQPAGIGGIGGGTYQVSYDIIALGFSAIR